MNEKIDEKNMKELMQIIGSATNEKIKHTNSELYSTIKLIIGTFGLIVLLILTLIYGIFSTKSLQSIKQSPKQIIVEKIIIKPEKSGLKSFTEHDLFKTVCKHGSTWKYYRRNNHGVYEYYTISKPKYSNEND